jgi:anti-sigma factor RsiW
VSCENWRGKLDAYVDGELSSAEAAALGAHLRECAACASAALDRVQMKRSVAFAGKRYEPSAELRARITKLSTAKPRRGIADQWKVLLIPALALLLITLGVKWYVGREAARRDRLYSELADLHVTALASTTPVDVISSDRHTVKPWFQGKIPFSFNLPELQGTDFTLVGGKVTYLAQTPGAQLIYQLRKHQISVFIFPDQGEATSIAPSNPHRAVSFNEENWTQNGLRYFVVGDVSGADIAALSNLLRDAG